MDLSVARCCPEGGFVGPNGAKGFLSEVNLLISICYCIYLLLLSCNNYYLYLNCNYRFDLYVDLR